MVDPHRAPQSRRANRGGPSQQSAVWRWWIIVLLIGATAANAHTARPTVLLVSFDRPDAIDVKLDIDLTLLLGSPERYYALASESEAAQAQDARQLASRVLEAVQLKVGEERLRLEYVGFAPAVASKGEYLDSSAAKLSTFRFSAPLPASTEPIRLVVPVGADVTYPIAVTMQVPARRVSVTRWLDGGVHESDPFAWSALAPRDATAAHADVSATAFDPENLPWSRQLALYLRLGFSHIVPEGKDHILFVLGLFFLGISWRKLLSQTSVFTVAHATTLFLSSYGIFTLPSKYVEPMIAISIAVIALENVFKPQLGWWRLAIVFGFGLIHGLGFASSLSDIPFPRHDFLLALLGFNFGVDFGQLFVIATAFLLVGWFRNKTWFRRRIAIPCSLGIAAIGIVWAVERIYLYRGS